MTPKQTSQNPKPYDVSIFEVLVHRRTIEAVDLVEANMRARELWDDCGSFGFRSDTLGRTDIIICEQGGKQ